MFALIQKSDNKILRVGPEGPELSTEKPFYWIECPEDCNVSWTYDGESFNAPVTPEPEPFIPTSVTMRQARIALHRNGLLSGVEAAIQTMDEPFRTEAEIEWEYAQTVDMDSQFTQMLALAIGLNQEQLNDLFEQASSI